MKALAVVCARNEELHVASALRDLIAEGLDVVLIDNESTDRTVPLARDYLGRGLLEIVTLPWRGWFSLREQLDAKWAVIARSDHDWIVHADADEWLSAPGEGQSLLEGLREADAAGCNCVHFNEFVFVPRPGDDLSGTDYRRRSTRYYFYRVAYPFLMRAWKKDAGLDNREHAGHFFSDQGTARPFGIDFPLRHYIVLSEAQARRKYLGRRFDEAEVAGGWHGDKIRTTYDNLSFPGDDRMHALPDWSSKAFDVSSPRRAHYWEWPVSASARR